MIGQVLTAVRCSLSALFLGATAALAAIPARVFPEIPIPEKTKSYWIGQYVEQNTIPMQIRGFESYLSAKDVEAYYTKWFADKRGFGAKDFGATRLLGARMGNYQVTVQILKKDNITSGTITAAAVYEPSKELEDRLASLGSGFPKFGDTAVISDTVSYDPETRNRTIILKNEMSVETNALMLREEMVKLSWSLVQDQTVAGGTSSALVFRKGSQEMVVTITKKLDRTWIISSQTGPD